VTTEEVRVPKSDTLSEPVSPCVGQRLHNWELISEREIFSSVPDPSFGVDGGRASFELIGWKRRYYCRFCRTVVEDMSQL